MSNCLEPTIEADFLFAVDEPFKLESGESLQPVTLRYTLYGELTKARDNAILVCHALSGSARVADWWPQLVGPGLLFDTTRYCVIGINILGSCYGSTGPTSSHPTKPGEIYGNNFPLVTIGDIVRAQARLIDHLGIERLQAVVGGSNRRNAGARLGYRFPGKSRKVHSNWRCAAFSDGACAQSPATSGDHERSRVVRWSL